MKIKYLLIAFLFICFLPFSWAQNYSITGKVTGTDKKLVEMGNVILLSPKDSSIIKGDLFTDGHFQLNSISNDSLILKIVSLGFFPHTQVVYHNNHDTLIDIGIIALSKSGLLKEVEISAQIPLFENDGNKVKVNVENTGLSSSGTVLDILKKSPGVQVSSSDNVSVFGKGQALIFLDGMPVASIDILKSIPSSEIKTIEIISNPSAKYDAAGRSVINIITKKSNLEGFNGNLIQNTLFTKYWFEYSGLRFSYKRKKWATNLSYGISNGRFWSSDNYYRKFNTNDSVITEMYNNIYDITRNEKVQNYAFGAVYSIDSVSNIGLQYNGFYNQTKTLSVNENIIQQDSITNFSLFTSTTSKPLLINNSVNLNYSKKFDTLASELTAAIQFGDFSSINKSNIEQTVAGTGFQTQYNKRNRNTNGIKIYTAQIDDAKSFSKKWTLSSGIKNSYITKSSDIQFENQFSSGEWIVDPSYANGFNFNENILGLYSEINFKAAKINFRVGARGEQTNTYGFSKLLQQKVVDRNYFNIFPSAYAGYNFNKDLTAAVTYSSRITRPTYQDMDPFISYIDSLSSFRGNPYLKPEYTQSIDAALIYMQEASIKFSYSRTDGALKLMVDKLNDGTDAFVATTKNLNQAETYTIGLTIPYELSWWTTYNYFGYSWNKFNYTASGILIQNSKPLFYVSLYDEFRFKKLFSMELNYEYTSSGVDGIFAFQPFQVFSANIKKTFFKDHLTVRFIANDIFSSNVTRAKSNVPGYQVDYTSKYGSHYYVLALNYKFGKLKPFAFKDHTVNQEEYDRIKMGK